MKEYELERNQEVLNIFPLEMQNKLIELKLEWVTLYKIKKTYLKLIKYKNMGLIEYGIDKKGNCIYSTKPFKRKKEQLIKRYKELEEFIIYGSESSHNHYQDSYMYLKIPHPSFIIKKFEDEITSTDKIFINEIIKILIGNDRLQKRTSIEKQELNNNKTLNALILKNKNFNI